MKTILILLALVAQAHATLIYDVSVPVGGGGQLAMTDLGADPYGLEAGQSIITFGTMQSRIWYDPVGQTLRQAGSIPLFLSDNPIVLKETRGVTVTVDQSIADRLSFDSGVVPLAFDSATHARLHGTTEIPFALTDVSVNWTMETGGQTLANSFNYKLNGFWTMLDPFFADFTFSDDLSSIAMPGLSSFGVLRGGIASGNELTAANGITVRLLSGISDLTNHFRWSTSGVVAIAVPDAGSTLMLLGLSVAGLLCHRRRLA